ncbi:MAG TPA: hypothetical protein VGM94_14100, partial [Galbitalea sp.]
MTWHPPLTLLSGLELPGADPSDLDITWLHRLVRQNQCGLEEVAARLGTAVDVVRHVLTDTPAPRSTQHELGALDAAR